MFRRRAILLILFAIGCLSVTSVVSLLLYFDPYINKALALGLLLFSFTL